MTGETIADEGECTMTTSSRSKTVIVENTASERGRETATAASAGGLARLREGTTLLDAARGAAGAMRKGAGETMRDARESHHKAGMAAGARELKAAAMPARSFVAPRQVDLLAPCLRSKTRSEHRTASKGEKSLRGPRRSRSSPTLRIRACSPLRPTRSRASFSSVRPPSFLRTLRCQKLRMARWNVQTTSRQRRESHSSRGDCTSSRARSKSVRAQSDLSVLSGADM